MPLFLHLLGGGFKTHRSWFTGNDEVNVRLWDYFENILEMRYHFGWRGLMEQNEGIHLDEPTCWNLALNDYK